MYPGILLLGIALAAGGCDMQAASGAGAALAAADTTDPPRVRRVWDTVRDYANPSPDGRLIAFVDWTTGDVAVHELATGEDRLATDKGTWEENGSWAEEPLFSPDGRSIVYTYGNTQAGDPFRYELRRVELGDTTTRLLYALDWETEEFINPLDWHPAAGILVEVNRLDGVTELAVVPASGGTPRPIRRFAAGEPHPHAGEFSTDGGLVVYGAGGDVRTIRPDGSSDRSLDIGPASLLALLPDGRVLFHAERDGRRGMWTVAFEDGRRTGEPVLIRDGIPGVVPGGLAANGYFYAVPVDGPRIYLSAVDVAGGRMLMQPNALTAQGDGWATAPAWSPDGRSIAYTLRRPGEDARIMLRTIEGEHVRELAHMTTSGRADNLVWTRDGRSILLIGEGSREPALYEIDVASGAVTRVLEPAGQRFALSPDERTLVMARNEGIVVRDRASGAERVLVPRPVAGELAVSPDGRTVAFLRRGDGEGSRIYSIPIGGGPERLVARVPEGRHLEGPGGTLAYTADGSHLIAVAGDAENHHHLVAFDVATGEEKTLLDLGRRPDGPERTHARLHPDGRRIVYASGYERGEMWLMEGVAD